MNRTTCTGGETNLPFWLFLVKYTMSKYVPSFVCADKKFPTKVAARFLRRGLACKKVAKNLLQCISTLPTLHTTLHSLPQAHCTQNIPANFTLYALRCTRYIVHVTLYTLHCTHYVVHVHCTV